MYTLIQSVHKTQEFFLVALSQDTFDEKGILLYKTMEFKELYRKIYGREGDE